MGDSRNENQQNHSHSHAYTSYHQKRKLIFRVDFRVVCSQNKSIIIIICNVNKYSISQHIHLLLIRTEVRLLIDKGIDNNQKINS